ncbi:MAG: DUF2520 domain-containing protein [Actinobacteria bacterium]|nr:DUF2520 domain-containing protein [Actinomycetota bacterium]
MNGVTYPWTAIGVIGPGRVGTALGAALADAGQSVVAVAGRPGASSTDRFVAAVGGAEPMSTAQVAQAADLVLLTVGDDELPGVARSLAADDAVISASRWIHTSGRHGAAVLRPITLSGGRVAACHPSQTFPTPGSGRDALPGTAWAVTATPHDRGWAHAFVTLLSGAPVDVREADRVRYHAALTVAANGTSAVVALARDLLRSSGVHQPERFLEPLVTQSASNAARHGAGALTGPVRRGDGDTVAAHLHDLAEVLPEAVPAYRALALLALSYARRAGLDESRAAAIRTILET